MKLIKRHLTIVTCSLALTVFTASASTQPAAVAEPVQKMAVPAENQPLSGPMNTGGRTVNILHQGNIIASLSIPVDSPISVSGSTSTSSKDGDKITYRGEVNFSAQLPDNQKITVNAEEVELINK